MSSPTKTAVTILGLGNLGQALVATLLRAGHPTTVWNRSPGRAEALVAQGASEAATLAEAVAASPLVIVSVLDTAAARQVLGAATEALPGRAVVNVTSGTPEVARELAALAAEHGADYLDGAIYAVPQTIGTADSTINYSGAAAVHQKWGQQLDVLGRGTYLGADPGLASVYDLAILGGMYGMLGGFLHAAAMADAAGVRAGELTPMLVSWLIGCMPALTEFAAEIDARDYTTSMSNLDINQAGLANIVDASAAQGVDTGILAPLRKLVDEQVAAGHGAASLARVFEVLRRQA
ncbi:NAD(P)-dependent oxidoreductase [Streptoalloteichus hindustanus]|uniref:3-hydroxyisobutyrate dehydrogenase n=1 Tax=Streptoalloteichus hindustanus TaxID=2017 RepID=A0A1M5FCG7_STRHI|nr:NAD(P)-binding domain-containing protein [Streptoalloteichus hindustanus]SHF89196.1 3-hydroxyisobutyrate dehydrogenase [Streptoalloteichus hindustanus]